MTKHLHPKMEKQVHDLMRDDDRGGKPTTSSRMQITTFTPQMQRFYVFS